MLHTRKTRERLPGLWRVEQEEDGVPVCRVSFRRLPGRTPSQLLQLLAARRGLSELLPGFRPDLLHGHFYDAAAATARLARRLGVPYVLTEHSSHIADRSLPLLERRAARRAFRGAARVLPVSRTLQRALESYGFEGRYEIVPNVVDLESFSPAPRPPRSTLRLAAVTRMTPIKGIPDLLQALRLLADRRSGWACDLVGGGEREAEYRALASHLGLDGRVAFLGELRRPEVARRLRQADLFVLASHLETFSVATVEALACGVPAVVTACGGPEELVTPESGVIVPPRQPAALAAALDGALAGLARFDSAAIARGVAARFGAEAVGGRLLQIYGSVLEEGKKGGRGHRTSTPAA